MTDGPYQMTLDDALADPPTNGSRGSGRAARAVKPFISGMRQRAYEYILAQGAHGATREEIAQGTGMRLSSVCGRVSELLKAGAVVDACCDRKGSSDVEVQVLRVKYLETSYGT